MTVFLFLLMIVAAPYYIRMFWLWMNNGFRHVEYVIHSKIAYGTWFEVKHLVKHDCRWPFINWYLNAAWCAKTLKIRNIESGQILYIEAPIYDGNLFDATFLRTHEFQYLPKGRKGKRKSYPTEPAEFIEDPVMTGA